MSQEAFLNRGGQQHYSFQSKELKQIVNQCLHRQRVNLNDKVSSISDFMTAIGLHDHERGLETTGAGFVLHKRSYGLNNLVRGRRWQCRFSTMPFFYLFLLCVAAGNAAADYWLYEYQAWYAQCTLMLCMVFVVVIVYGCGRVRISKRENLEQKGTSRSELQTAQDLQKSYNCTRDGIVVQVAAEDLTVGDKILLSPGDLVPADCVIFHTENGSEIQVDETLITGEPVGLIKKSLGHYTHGVNISSKTVLFSQSKILTGSAQALVIAVGANSSAHVWYSTREIEEDHEGDNDLQEKHSNLVQILVVVLMLFSGVLLVQCGMSKNIDWVTAANIAIMMFVYGFPYILSIPSIWDRALKHTSRNLLEKNVMVKNQDSIEEAASIDYLCVQTIGILDKEHQMEHYRDCIQYLTDMGIKVVLVTGQSKESAIECAIKTGILKKEHAKICGAAISGDQLRSIYNGRKFDTEFEITPEYLTVVYQATPEDRCTLVDYLTKVHPGRITANSPSIYGQGLDLKGAPPVASVGVIGSGDNDVKMMQKAKVAFSPGQVSNAQAKDNADMILMTDNLKDVIVAVTKGRQYKDHLMKMIMLQMPASLAAIAMVLAQVFWYDTILVTVSFIFLINLIYFPLGIQCILRENAETRFADMIKRWRSVRYPGTKTITGYMRSEYVKTSVVLVALFQIGAMGALFYHADVLFHLVHEELDWNKDDPLYVTQGWLDEHIDQIGDHYELNDLTDKGQMFMIIFQTFAYMQIFAIINARRPSFKDINPFEDFSILTASAIFLLLCFQFTVCYMPLVVGINSISIWSNLLCGAMGALSVIWFTVCKMVMAFILGGEDPYPTQI